MAQPANLRPVTPYVVQRFHIRLREQAENRRAIDLARRFAEFVTPDEAAVAAGAVMEMRKRAR